MSSTTERRIVRLEQRVFGGPDGPLGLNSLTIEEEKYLLAHLIVSDANNLPAEREEAEQTILRLAGSVRESHLLAVVDHWVEQRGRLKAQGILRNIRIGGSKEGL